MPSGYTHRVQNGEIVELRDFALACARAFGALIMMRDDPESAPIPQQLTADTKYHDEAIAMAEAALQELPGLSAAEVDARAATEFQQQLDSHLAMRQKRYDSKVRYEAMLEKVRRWTVPDDLDGLKQFMLKQLQESIEWDCSDSHIKEPVRLTGEDWRRLALAKASQDLAYHKNGRAEEISRNEGRNKWLRQLFASVPPAAREISASHDLME